MKTDPQGHRHRLSVWHIRFICMLLIGSLGVNLWQASLRTPAPSGTGRDIRWPRQAQAHASLGKRIRVATYNIHRAKGLDGRQDVSRIADVLKDMDVVALNELAGSSHWGSLNQAEQLGCLLSVGWLFAPNQRRWHLDSFGNGLLSRAPTEYWYNEQLACNKNETRSFRNLLTAQVRVDEYPVSLFTTHLDSRGKDIRMAQLREVVSRFKAHPHAILMGDLNTKSGNAMLNELFQDIQNVDAIRVALGDQDPPNRIDWIITRGFKVHQGGFEPSGASDHPCFWVDLEIIQ
jgi:endonuclease/exonuclease/phosphatase family metal-dependent hydrolase